MPEPHHDEPPGRTPEPRPGHDPARARFYFFGAHRVVGVVLVILGFMAMQGKLDWGEGVGKVLAVVGLIEFFVIPLVFARMWRSIPK